MKPGDRLVCAFVAGAPSQPFKPWPLHVTVVPWFRAEIGSKQLADELQACLKKYQPFKANVGQEASFGHGKTVNLIEAPTYFEPIEAIVRQVLKQHDSWIVDETTKRQRPYRPHVTAQSSGRLLEGDNFRCRQLQLIEQLGDYKRVVGKIELSHG